MNKSSVKLGNLIANLENLLESNESFKSGNTESKLQLSLVKEENMQLQEHISKLNSQIALTEQKLRDDL